ncbi:hypothetical protein SAMN02745664_101250 [Moraxella cuniculi DSM 21768]|uniref:Uncharacterized protein n=1 Tax=Moraxella cuniculi DSM 21768 TaxID=1122245 RepID=A0A1N7DGM7_9GAMM|nr:hypothetical protein [Moraxella cuniculi]OOS08045.1 hypothetical protein B0189_01545 [Moraxella cuniculi]SIR74940.1 hypothetical protein SAMN02745664_101250 [Moraxella cuniculi DSM 21768]
MKWISDNFHWRAELKLSASFSLNRFMPIFLYFATLFLVMQLASPEEADAYVLYASLYNVALALGLGMGSGLRFYAARLPHRQIFVPMLVLATVAAVLISLGFLLYTSYALVGDLANSSIAIAFAISIIIAFYYDFLVIYGESKKVVQGSNYSNALALLIFFVIFIAVYQFGAISESVAAQIAICYMLAETAMLGVLSYFAYRNRALFSQDDTDEAQQMTAGRLVGMYGAFIQRAMAVIIPIISFSVPIVLLQFFKRLSMSQALLWLKDTVGAASILQTLFMVSLLISVFAVAVSNNGFVFLAKFLTRYDGRASVWRSLGDYAYYTASGLAFLMALSAVAVWLICIGLLDFQQPFLAFVREYPIAVLLFLCSEMLLWALMTYGRALGETWRIQSLWLMVLMFAGLVLSMTTVDLPSLVWGFVVANMAACVYAAFWLFDNVRQPKVNKA